MKEISLTKGQVALVDDDDYEFLMQWKWYYDDRYAARKVSLGKRKFKTVKMHREIMNAEKGTEIDHINGSGLDNRKSNLRPASHQQNIMNQRPRKNTSSRFKGVSLCKSRKKFHAYINCGKRKTLGYFRDERDAARAYNVAAIQYFGQFARLNVIEDAA